MSKFFLPIKHSLSHEQFQYVSDSLKVSMQVDSITEVGESLEVVCSGSESAEQIETVLKRLIFVSKNLNRDLVFENEVEPRFLSDPQPYLEQTRSVIPVDPGFYAFQGEFLAVFHAVNRQVRKIAYDLDAVEQEYPTVWPIRLFKQIDYFHEFPQQVILCTTVRDDYASRTKFSKLYAKDSEFETVPVDELMGESKYGLEPAVCDCCYFGLGGTRNLKDSFYTCYNKVFRNEKSLSNQLDRLTNFSVRDIMFVGTEEFVLHARQKLTDKLSGFLAELSLNSKIETANDPFFANESAMKSAFQNSHRLKYELLVKIPHLGKHIAAGSINYHMDFFGKSFDIHTASSSIAHSGCIGVGMERMAYALFCQHGECISDWPSNVKKFLEL